MVLLSSASNVNTQSATRKYTQIVTHSRLQYGFRNACELCSFLAWWVIVEFFTEFRTDCWEPDSRKGIALIVGVSKESYVNLPQLQILCSWVSVVALGLYQLYPLWSCTSVDSSGLIQLYLLWSWPSFVTRLCYLSSGWNLVIMAMGLKFLDQFSFTASNLALEWMQWRRQF